MIATHNIKAITFEQNFICIEADGKLTKIELMKISNKLAVATEMQRMIYTISPSGYGIHWPLIDEDISINALLEN